MQPKVQSSKSSLKMQILVQALRMLLRETRFGAQTSLFTGSEPKIGELKSWPDRKSDLWAGPIDTLFCAGAAHADVGDAIKSLDPSVSTGSEPKIGDFGQAGPPGDVGKAIADGARGAQVCA